MGYLHDGHASLLRIARAECRHVAASVFVNPTQFGPGEDLGRYPRDLPRDQALLQGAGCDLLFVPEVAEIYPPGFETSVDLGSVAAPLEGAHRPGHFRGVATVVAKLFNIVQPRRAYFGCKDAQQLVVVRKLMRDLHREIEIVPVPIVRESDGLAMSSRNAYLSPEQRRAAPVLFRALGRARELWGSGTRHPATLRATMLEVLQAEPQARVDYVSVADPATFRELSPRPRRRFHGRVHRQGTAHRQPHPGLVLTARRGRKGKEPVTGKLTTETQRAQRMNPSH
jgi:pantoate--beta-alanine ligase